MNLLLTLATFFFLQGNLAQYVNPFIGTDKMGHTYPGASMPFGMVQLSPDTDTLSYESGGKYNKDVYRYCAGYQYSDRTIVGFSHTHFSGTGHSDLGDILIMPTTGRLQLNPGTAENPQSGFRSSFSHKREMAEPGYYRVHLDDHGIEAELAATTRVGIHRYTFPKSDSAHIILDLVHGIYNYEGKNVWTFVRVENDSTITGYRQTNGWARTRTVYFAIKFSKPFKSYGSKNFGPQSVYRGFWRKFDQTSNFPELAGSQLRAHFDFDTKEGEEVMVKVALSPVSTNGALANMASEASGWDFEEYRRSGYETWERELEKIEVETLTDGEKINFYTAMYHAMLGTTIYMDTDGSYRGLDMNIHKADGFTNYTTFSLWDTYRALHPLYNIIEPKRNSDIVNSMIAHYNQSIHKMLPVWSHYANENWCMIGYHSVSVLADAAVKGIGGFDAVAALEACAVTARNNYYDGLGLYIQKGFVPEDLSGNSVSKTLEYAYDDWAIAQMALKLGRTDLYEEFSKRALSYKNLFDKSSGFMRPKLSDGTFKKEFDPLDTHGQGFIEGNAWNYSLYVPHHPDSLISLMGGSKRFAGHLDSLFTMELPDKYFAQTEDITREGIIGNYIHGNEPSHHVPYLFNYAGMPWKGQKYIREILDTKYNPAVDGLSGNDDCGQMSAWYIFSSLGFYPVAPGSDTYDIGSPSVVSAVIKLEGGREFRIETLNQSSQNVYVKRALLNGVPLSRPLLRHSDITAGGTLTFEMSSTPEEKAFSPVIYSSEKFTLFSDKVIQGSNTATVIFRDSIESNYFSPLGTEPAGTKRLRVISKDLSAKPRYTSEQPVADALFNMSLEEALINIEADSTFRTGAKWSGVWTRDISYSILLAFAYHESEVAKISLMKKVKRGRIIQDTGSGGAWPVSSDRTTWALAAWEIYKVTGDIEWLKTIYPIIKNTLEDDFRTLYNPKTGLFRGESSFLDWREQTYPKWMDNKDIFVSENLGTNAVHYQAHKILAMAANLLGEEGSIYEKRAEGIKNAINKNFWMAERGFYGNFLYGRDHLILSERFEALGEALNILFGVAGEEKARLILSSSPVTEFGASCIYPQIPGIPPYHNNAIWPFVQSFWNLAAAKAGNEKALVHGLASVYRAGAFFLTNYENIVADTGDYNGTEINSDRMLWSMAGNLAMVHRVFTGMNFEVDGIRFSPVIPEVFKGTRKLENFKYRKAILDITVKGFGRNTKSVTLDGTPLKDGFLPASISGRHSVEIIMDNTKFDSDKFEVSDNHTSLPAPEVSSKKGKLTWSPVEGAVTYRVYRNGRIEQITDKNNYNISDPEGSQFRVSAVDSLGWESFTSEPLFVIADKNKIKVAPGSSPDGKGFAEISNEVNRTLDFTAKVAQDGTYLLSFTYANGSGPWNTDNKCAIRTVYVNKTAEGTIVFPQRGENLWNEWGVTNSVRVKLKKGLNNFSLVFEEWNNNMNTDINRALVKEALLEKVQ